jgi:hypothetical protein
MVISSKESAGSYLAERRRTVRSPYCSPAELTAASGTALGMVRNLNADGLYMEINGHYRIDEPVSLCFVFRSRMHSIRLLGRIRHVASNGVGIEFTADQPRRESESELATRRFNPTSHEKKVAADPPPLFPSIRKPLVRQRQPIRRPSSVLAWSAI